MHFGRELPLFFDIFDFSIEAEQLDKSTYLNNLLDTLHKVYETVYANLQDNQIAQNIRYAQKAKLRQFHPNDTVYIKSRESYNNKLTGPFEVLSRNSEVTYTVRIPNNPYARSLKIHVDRLILAPPRRPYLEAQQFASTDSVIEREQNNRPSTSTAGPQQSSPHRVQTRYFLRSKC